MIQHFHRPASVREALALKRRLRGRAAFLAGGTWLNSGECPSPPEHAISLEALGLGTVARDAKHVTIGACCTLQQLIDDARVPAPLKAALGQIVPRNIRNAATLGGQVAANHPDSDVLPMLVALGASLVLVRDGGRRTLPVEDYAAKPVSGLITHVRVPRAAASRVAACRNVRGSANARSIASVAVAATVTRGVLSTIVLAIGGVLPHVVRASKAEALLAGKPLPPLDEVQALVARELKLAAAPTGSRALRRYEAAALAALALRDALATKGGRR